MPARARSLIPHARTLFPTQLTTHTRNQLANLRATHRAFPPSFLFHIFFFYHCILTSFFFFPLCSFFLVYLFLSLSSAFSSHTKHACTLLDPSRTFGSPTLSSVLLLYPGFSYSIQGSPILLRVLLLYRRFSYSIQGSPTLSGNPTLSRVLLYSIKGSPSPSRVLLLYPELFYSEDSSSCSTPSNNTLSLHSATPRYS
jgi:hypothetical protein